MNRRLSFASRAVPAALVTLVVAAGARADHDSDRGPAILSPLESPYRPTKWEIRALTDKRPMLVPYYPGYCRRGKNGSIPGSYSTPLDGAADAAVAGSAGYGIYTGGPRNEAALRQLGGGSGVEPGYLTPPTTTVPTVPPMIPPTKN